jgi:NTE family protein
MSRAPALDALMASAAIPAVFAPVNVGARALMDGGVANNTPIKHAGIWMRIGSMFCLAAMRAPSHIRQQLRSEWRFTR